MRFKITSIITVIARVWGYLKGKKHLWDYLVKIVPPLIHEAEGMAKDGVIDRAERKQLVMMAIEKLERDGKIKLNWITRFIVGRVVNMIAKKLPDIKLSAEAKELLNKIK